MRFFSYYKKYLVVITSCILFLLLMSQCGLYISKGYAIKMMARKNYHAELIDYKLISDKDRLFYLCNTSQGIVWASSTKKLFFYSVDSMYINSKNDYIVFDMFGHSVDNWLLYGYCDDLAIKKVKLVSDYFETLVVEIDKTRLFAFKYEGDAYIWDRLEAYNSENKLIYSYYYDEDSLKKYEKY